MQLYYHGVLVSTSNLHVDKCMLHRVEYYLSKAGGTAVGKIISRAFQARLDYQKRVGRPVSVSEVAREANLDRNAIARLEANETERYDGDILAGLCEFYGVTVGDLLEFDPTVTEKVKQTPGHVGVVLPR